MIYYKKVNVTNPKIINAKAIMLVICKYGDKINFGVNLQLFNK